MIAFLYYPLYLFIFWYKNVVVGLFIFFVEFNRYVAKLLSFQSLLKTFFKPLKNEYRDGLVLFSILFGIAVKTVLISVTSLIIVILLAVEVLAIFFLTVLPILLLVLVVSPKAILR